MTATETASYIKHHLGLASRSDQLFTDAPSPSPTPRPTVSPARSPRSPQASPSLTKAAQSAVTEVLD
ncbi:hypothetical protein [Streptomyces goshikiensis]|uniref:hypothetical protein n=1 Tax=Streptomyces goshikiensis TaxID=1942 RepID=UPI003715B6DA